MKVHLFNETYRRHAPFVITSARKLPHFLPHKYIFEGIENYIYPLEKNIINQNRSISVLV